MATCPECEGTVPTEESVEVGEVLSCPDCGVELEVKKTNPITLELAPQEDEDWGQ